MNTSARPFTINVLQRVWQWWDHANECANLQLFLHGIKCWQLDFPWCHYKSILVFPQVIASCIKIYCYFRNWASLQTHIQLSIFHHRSKGYLKKNNKTISKIKVRNQMFVYLKKKKTFENILLICCSVCIRGTGFSLKDWRCGNEIYFCFYKKTDSSFWNKTATFVL